MSMNSAACKRDTWDPDPQHSGQNCLYMYKEEVCKIIAGLDHLTINIVVFSLY